MANKNMNLTEQQIADNWQSLIQRISDNFTSNRQDKLLKLYNDLSEQMMLAPASGIEHFHNCFPGGYIDHVLRVMDCTERLYVQWEEMGADISGYTKEELMFCALNHDLGKVGDTDNEYYVPNPSEWHRKNQGKIYDPNPNIQHMTVPHRSIWLLSNYNIQFSKNEMIGILTHDGVYDSANDAYLKPWGKEKALWNNLPIILHHADHMASRIEYENWKSGNSIEKALIKKPKASFKQPTISTQNSTAQDMFKDLFGEA
tara:strand:- start:1520 stop:2293 length:774 start_codon:yes stop_codon:yes gene_type:complete